MYCDWLKNHVAQVCAICRERSCAVFLHCMYLASFLPIYTKIPMDVASWVNMELLHHGYSMTNKCTIVYFCKYFSPFEGFFNNERWLSRIRAYITSKSRRCVSACAFLAYKGAHQVENIYKDGSIYGNSPAPWQWLNIKAILTPCLCPWSHIRGATLTRRVRRCTYEETHNKHWFDVTSLSMCWWNAVNAATEYCLL